MNLLSILSLSIALGFAAQPQSEEKFFGFTSFAPSAAWQILEKENQLRTLCPDSMQPKARKDCENEALKPVTWKLDLYSKPDEKSKLPEQIQITARPGVGLNFEWLQNEKKTTYEPDQNQGDWGYEGYFLYTAAGKNGDWIKLPKYPFAQEVWINPTKAFGKSASNYLVPIEPNGVYTIDDKNIVVIGIEKNLVKIRAEAPSDNPCTSEPENETGASPVPAATPKVERKGFEYFYDSHGHLKLRIANPRGC